MMRAKSIHIDSGEYELKILFISPENAKKAVYATALLEKLVTVYPRAKVTVMGKMPGVALFGAAPHTDKMIVVENFAAPDVLKEALRRKWDMLIDAENLPLSVLVRAKEKARSVTPPFNEHPLKIYADMLSLNESDLNPFVWLAPELVRGAEKRLFKKEYVIGVAPFAEDGSFLWEPENFVTLLKRLTYPGNLFPASAIALIGFEKNRIAANQILAELPEWQRVNLVGGLGVLSIAACIGKCRLFLGGDNIMTHMAAVENVATLAINAKDADIIPRGRYTSVMQAENPTVDDVEQAVKDLWHGKLSQK
ncbi:MAG: hypothetical protein IKD08_05105 [Alphaproteobacteria bacterium]|nr:hypothetical protein [Alphaproteobacteria bacterium]